MLIFNIGAFFNAREDNVFRHKSTVEDIKHRFDADVDRFSNLGVDGPRLWMRRMFLI